MNIHFICRGNILRSVIAETYLKSLGLTSVNSRSSGTSVNWDDPTEKVHFANSMKLLERHNIRTYAKEKPEQLTQLRLANQDVVVCMSRRVIDEAQQLVELPAKVINWNIIDIGEAHRTVLDDRELYEEEIYKEITDKVDRLVQELKLH